MPIGLIIIGIALLVAVVCLIRTAKGKGWAGERSVARKLRRLPHGYIVLNDLLLPTAGKGSTQVDHIVVSEYGIFIIETKNYTGIITGTEHGENWTKNMFGRKFSMYNPIAQNDNHIRAVARLLTKAKIGTQLYSIITFPKAATVKVRSERCDIVYFNQLRKMIRQYKDVQMDWDTAQRAADVLRKANITNWRLRREHMKYVKSQS